MKSTLFLSLLTSSLVLAASPAAMAQRVVSQVDADTLRVVDYSGKPPYARQTISRERQPELYAYHAARIDHDPQPLLASEGRRGAPGKNLPRTVLRVSGDPAEIAEFARFEEAASDETKPRRAWQGAPGKGRAFAR